MNVHIYILHITCIRINIKVNKKKMAARHGRESKRTGKQKRNKKHKHKHKHKHALTSEEKWHNASRRQNKDWAGKKVSLSNTDIKESLTSLVSLRETIHECTHCGSTDIDIVQVQTRGADEPMTCYYTCNSCKHKWTEN